MQVLLHQHMPVQHEPLLPMMSAFVRTGGLASEDDVICMLRRRCEQPLSKLARWIVSRSVVNFVHERHTMLPLFQFDLVDMTLRPGPQRVLAELGQVFDDWEIASWFATPNGFLNGARPLDLMQSDLAEVIQAARADRFIATG